jgi:hypothetical protein
MSEARRGAGERRRAAALAVLGAAVIIALLLSTARAPAAASLPPASPEGAGAAVLVGLNGTQTFRLWAPPGHAALWDVLFCNAAGANVTVAVRPLSAPREVRQFLFHVGDASFGWDGRSAREWRAALAPGECARGALEVLVDGRAPANTVYVVAVEVVAWVSG